MRSFDLDGDGVVSRSEWLAKYGNDRWSGSRLVSGLGHKIQIIVTGKGTREVAVSTC